MALSFHALVWTRRDAPTVTQPGWQARRRRPTSDRRCRVGASTAGAPRFQPRIATKRSLPAAGAVQLWRHRCGRARTPIGPFGPNFPGTGSPAQPQAPGPGRRGTSTGSRDLPPTNRGGTRRTRELQAAPQAAQQGRIERDWHPLTGARPQKSRLLPRPCVGGGNARRASRAPMLGRPPAYGRGRRTWTSSPSISVIFTPTGADEPAGSSTS